MSSIVMLYRTPRSAIYVDYSQGEFPPRNYVTNVAL